MKNPGVVTLLQLITDNRKRKRAGIFIAEGLIELGMCIKGGMAINELWVCREIVEKEPEMLGLLRKAAHIPTVEITPDVFSKLAYRGTTGGVLAIGEVRNHILNALKLGKNPLILVVDGLEKPGNLGAMLRTADAANVDAVLVSDPLTDLYNPNTIRASLGTTFTCNIGVATTQETIAFLRQHKVNILCTALTASRPYATMDMTGPTAIVMGTEHDGLGPEWLRATGANIIIPMRGHIDSLNVSTAAAIVLFEAVRQRGE